MPIAATASAAAVIAIGAIAPAQAAPSIPGRIAAVAPTPGTTGKPTERELRKKLDALNTEAEKLTELYNKARVELGKAKNAVREATRQAAALTAQAAPAREQLSGFAASNYMTGGPDMMFASGNSTEGLASSAYLAQNRASVVNALQARIDQATKAQQDAQATNAAAQQAATQAEKARSAAKAKVDEVTKQLDKLTTTRVKDPKSGFTAVIKGSDLPAKMTRKALTKIGSPYVWAAAGPNSFDCSGLVVWAYAKVGKPGLPHYTGDLYQLGSKVDKGDLRAGDLVYFGGSLHHMGIYVGGGRYLHAPQTGDVVKISKVSDRSDYAGANRIS
ncbi:NlpC/P60 family protein [Actinomadura rudentiformis]|uniref:NlpC/P60 family protein n=2 Tax=Actinomadura rudentiformis TaxID=359158 RepID=A0A6H9Y8X4_9ACTN|nr:NlpC/P60 family protein [Actinomadura rudentiformis]